MPVPDITSLPLKKIRTDGGTQMRDHLDEDSVERYAEVLRGGGQLPPGTVYYDGEKYWAADVFHRLAAHAAARRTHIEVLVVPGTQRDAILHACGANAEHGKARSQADARRAIRCLLMDKEWGGWDGKTWTGWGDREIGRRCNVHHNTVSAVRADLSGSMKKADEAFEAASASGESSQIDSQGDDAPGSTRKVERGGTTYQMRVPVPGEPRTPKPAAPPAWLDFAQNAGECLAEARMHLTEVPGSGRATAAVEVAEAEVKELLGQGAV